MVGRDPADDTEYWHEVGTAGEVGFDTGWNNWNGGVAPVAFRMDDSGFVHLRGLAEPSVANPVIFQLPASWAPAYLHQYPIQRSGLTAGEVIPLYVHADGTVRVAVTPVAAQVYYLDNYRWRAA